MAAAKKSATKSAPKAAKAEPSWSEAPAPAAHAPTSSQSDDKTLALLAHLLGIFTWIIGPLVIWLVKKDQSPFVERHARESLNFQITVTIGYVIGFILTIIVIGLLITLAVWVLTIVFCIMATMAASKGQEYRYPFALRLIKGPNGSA